MSRTSQISELGKVDEHPRHFLAHLQLHLEGTNKHIRGPRRQEKARADEDLEAIRAAGELGTTLEESLACMRAEAKRRQDQARYEEEMRVTTLKRAPSRSMEVDGDDPWGELEYFEHDFLDNLCLDEDDEMQRNTPRSQRPSLTPLEATAELMNEFRPNQSTVADLVRLLDLRADPNAPVLVGRISPLRHVISFARTEHVEAMRTLLLKHGAKELQGDAERFERRVRCDIFEEERQRLWKEDPRDENPCQATLEATY